MRASAARSAVTPAESARRREFKRTQHFLERLEPRLLFTVGPLASSGDDNSAWLGHGPGCNCPICTGVGLDQIPVIQASPTLPAESNPLSSLPQLHSNPGATAKLFLDFNGNFVASWGSWTNATTPVYDQDGDQTTFSDGELASIAEIWARVAEDYAPFNIDVTTVDPGSLANGVVAQIAIGGNYSDWYGSASGGVAYVGGFSNGAPNVGFVFEDALGNGNAKYVAEAASHEAGHLFGLQHQALWSGGTMTQAYNQGNSAWAPIMGTGYYSERTTWYNGTTPFGATVYQDDLSIITGAANGFGYKTDDFGSTSGGASALPTIGTSVNFSGLIERYDDQDVLSFSTTGGNLTFQLAGSPYTNLDAVLELWDSGGNVLVSSSPSNSLGASFSTTVGVGTYYLAAHSLGDYGDMGTYTITGSLPTGASNPEIGLNVSGTAIADGGTLDFGTTTPGAAVTRTVTVVNQGSAALTLTAIDSNSLPAGFTLLSNLGATTLNAGQSTTFTIRLNAAALGSYSGSIQLFSNDSDESPYDLQLTGSVAAAEISVSLGGVDLTDGQAVDFGSTNVGTGVTKTFTVTNSGNSTLTLTNLNPATLPAGFSLVSNLGSTSLGAGQSTQFSIRLDASALGTFSGGLHLLSNDADEGSFDLNLSGTALAPEITLRLGGANVTDGQAINFGTVSVGSPVTRTFTIVNDGNDTLTLSSLGSLPSGFSIVSNLGSTSLAAGQSTTFTIQFDAGSAGSFSGNLALSNNDGDENPFDLALSGTAFLAAGEITASVAGQPLTVGESIDFGSTITGATLERTITIRNDGSAALNLTTLDPATLPAGFSIYQNLGSTTLNPGESTTLILRLDATAEGTFGGTVTLVNSDADENPFTFNVSGTVVAPTPAFKAIVDDGNTGSSFKGAWTVSSGSGKGYGNDSRTAFRGNGSITATWTFDGLAAGQYQVFATWKSNSSNATNSPFTIYDNTVSKGTTLVSQKVAPSGLTADGATWKSLGTVSIISGKLVVKLTNSANNKVAADAIRIERVPDAVAPTPDIGVSIGGYELTSGVSGITFGPRDLGQPQTYTFTVTNHGTGSLQLGAFSSLPAGFTLVQNLGTTFLTPGESTTFSLQLDASAGGSFGGSISLSSNDADESAFSFTVSGTVIDPNAPVLKIIDDGSAGFTQSGTWKTTTGKGYANDIRTAVAGTGSMQSTWTFTTLPDGQYNVWATWKISTAYATNATFARYNGSQLVGSTQVNERVGPTGLWDGTTTWQSIGSVTVVGGQLVVKLTNSANGQVVADAIRIEKVLSGNSALPLGALASAGASLPAASPNLSAWFGAVTASAASSPPASSEQPIFAQSSAPAGLSDNWHRPASLEDQLLAETLELLTATRNATATESSSVLESAADELARGALLA